MRVNCILLYLTKFLPLLHAMAFSKSIELQLA